MIKSFLFQCWNKERRHWDHCWHFLSYKLIRKASSCHHSQNVFNYIVIKPLKKPSNYKISISTPNTFVKEAKKERCHANFLEEHNLPLWLKHLIWCRGGGGGVRIYTVGKCTWHLSLHKFLELKSFKKKRIKINSFLIVYWNMNLMATLFPVKQYKSLFVICTFCALWHRLFLKTYDENLILPTQSTSIPAGLSLLIYPIYPAT